jgi:hypothetical protein
MPKISSYNTVTPQGDDKIIITQTNGTPTDVTKNITVEGLKTYIGQADDIPTPYMYVLKRPDVDATTKNDKAFVAMQKPIETDWLTKNPRLFMFRYKKQKVKNLDQVYVMKRANFIHPSHNNGGYQRTNFPGSNWASTFQTNQNGTILFPIPTEWDINSELKIAKTGSLITDFTSLRPTTYIEVPFNPLGFLFDSTNTEVTSLPSTTTDDFWGTRFSVIRPAANVNTENNPTEKRTSQIIMKFAIGIPNPAWTNTNHELPYIFGNLSNALMLKYQYNSSDYKIVEGYTLTQGSNGPASRTA